MVPLLILFFFLLAWKEPFPPIPEYGIELNFGIDNQGSGTVQQQAPVTPTPTEEPAEEVEQSEPTEETIEEETTEVVEQGNRAGSGRNQHPKRLKRQ